MTALLIGATTLAVMVLGWFGNKAYHRINAWGRKMNDIDRIFQEASEHDAFPVSSSGNRPLGGTLLPRGETHHTV